MNKKRKFFAYLITLIIASGLCIADALTGAEYVGLIKLALGAFVLTNAAIHFAPNSPENK